MIKIDFLSVDYTKEQNTLGKKMKPIIVACFVPLLIIAGVIIYLSVSTKGGDNQIIEILKYLGAALLAVFAYIFYNKQLKYEFDFWNVFADKNNASYKPIGSPEKELSIMFQQGYKQSIEHILTFRNDKEETVRLFLYSFVKPSLLDGDGKERTFYYTVFDFQFKGNVPNIFLNYKHDRYDPSLGQKLSLPTEFEKYFSVSVPSGYEIEALEIFTLDLLAAIIDIGIRVDIELVDHHMYFFVQQRMSLLPDAKAYLKQLTIDSASINKLVAIMEPVLNRFKFEKIGDKSHYL